MCGICGLLRFDDDAADAVAVKRMCRAIQHRGPDGEGVYANGPIALGHRRLSILDTSENGAQPMSYGDGRYQIVLNGEIYNFLEIREELEQHGYRFRTETDTEVVVAAYDRWGEDCQQRFNGMWALAIWDEARGCLFLSRDRFGIKPLFYCHLPRLFVFASELKAFVASLLIPIEEDTAALALNMQSPFALEGSARTLLKGVKRVAPGTSFLVSTGRVVERRWWNTLDHLPARVPERLEDQAAEFGSLFEDACRLRLRSDVPVGTSLSGGLDSTSVVCMVSRVANAGARLDKRRQAKDLRRTFVASYPGSALDELEFALEAARFAGAETVVRRIEAPDFLSTISEVVVNFEEIYLTPPIPMWLIYREMRKASVVVTLDGHGADELLGGYPDHVGAAMRGAGWLAHPLRMWDLARTYRGLFDGHGGLGFGGALSMIVRNDPTARGLNSSLRRVTSLGPPGAAGAEIGDDFFPLMNDDDQRLRQAIQEPLGQRLYRDFHQTILPTILRNFDRCSAGNGVEVRMPFMDWRLVCFAFSLPDASKIGDGKTKRVLRRAMAGKAPERLLRRTAKVGFNSPLADWFSGELAGWLDEIVNRPDFARSDIWDAAALQACVARHRHGEPWGLAEANRVWLALHTYLWQRLFVEHWSRFGREVN